MQVVRRLSPLAPWRLLRTLDEVRELPALRTQVKHGLKETKRLKKRILETQRQLDAQTKQTQDERKKLEGILTRVDHPPEDGGSTLRRQLGIPMDVHSGLLPANWLVRTLSFLGRARLDNLLKDHNWKTCGRCETRALGNRASVCLAGRVPDSGSSRRRRRLVTCTATSGCLV